MSATNKNLYLFLLWQNGRTKEKELLDDISQKFDIFQIYDVTWQEQDFAPSLARFYGKKLPKGCKKEKDTGRGSFLAILFFDPHEKIDEKGNNTNVIETKAKYRKFLGGNLLHASDSPVETNENILFLFGKNIEDILSESAFNKPVCYHKSIVGYPFWKDINEALNIACKCPDTTVDIAKSFIKTRHIDMVRRLLNAEKIWWFNTYKITTASGTRFIRLKKI